MQKYTIGDHVKIKLLNKTATVTDALYSDTQDRYLYIVKMDDDRHDYIRAMSEEDIELLPEEKHYRFEVFQADNNVVVAVMYESDGDEEREVGRAHGHIIHPGTIGIAQAASYAMKRIYIGMNGGKLLETEEKGNVL